MYEVHVGMSSEEPKVASYIEFKGKSRPVRPCLPPLLFPVRAGPPMGSLWPSAERGSAEGKTARSRAGVKGGV